MEISATQIAQRAFAPYRRPIRPQLSISVIVPTYRRPLDLARCVRALENQSRRADRIIVVIRADDSETRRYLEARTSGDFLTIVFVERPGVVAALNTGLEAAEGDIVAFTDDDAEPHADWLERIEAHFRGDASIGGVGGRDYVEGLESAHESSRVGEIQWFGRQIGNHHLGNGPTRDVDVLKGVNMSFRSDAIRGVRFDERLRGLGAQVHNELLFCFAVSHGGWRLLYDPAVAVDHFPAERFDDDRRSWKSQAAVRHASFNQTLSLLEYLPLLRRLAFIVWAFGIGTRELPGFAQCLRRRSALRRLASVFAGRLQALQCFASSHRGEYARRSS